MQIWMFFLSATIMARDALSLSPPDGYRQERSLPPPPPRPLAKAVPSSARLTPSPVPSPHHFPPPPLMPQQLLPNQCSFGTENSGGNTAGGFADANALYFLANDPAVCTGVIDNLEICFLVTSFTSGSNLHILTFRPQSSGRGVESYIKVDETSFTVTSENLEGAVVECKYLQPENNLYLEEGDVLGFITNQGVRIYLSASNEKDLYQYLPGSKRKRRKRLSVQEAFQVQSVANSDLIPKNATVTPVLKIVMNTSVESSTVIPMPTKGPKPNPCSNNKKSRSAISTFVFASVVVASAVIIMALFMMVCVLCCCLCGVCAKCSCKICKICKCCYKCNKYLCCKKRNQTSRQVGGISDQSMQYNELYLPSNPNTIITGGLKQSTKLHVNPAYGQQSSSSSRSSTGRHGFEHTYEDIDTLATS